MLKEIEYYRFPRTMKEAFGPDARLTVIEDRQHWTQEAAEYIGYAVAGLILGGCICLGMLGLYRLLFTAW